jgi:hypothetical protein
MKNSPDRQIRRLVLSVHPVRQVLLVLLRSGAESAWAARGLSGDGFSITPDADGNVWVGGAMNTLFRGTALV